MVRAFRSDGPVIDIHCHRECAPAAEIMAEPRTRGREGGPRPRQPHHPSGEPAPARDDQAEDGHARRPDRRHGPHGRRRSGGRGRGVPVLLLGRPRAGRQGRPDDERGVRRGDVAVSRPVPAAGHRAAAGHRRGHRGAALSRKRSRHARHRDRHPRRGRGDLQRSASTRSGPRSRRSGSSSSSTPRAPPTRNGCQTTTSSTSSATPSKRPLPPRISSSTASSNAIPASRSWWCTAAATCPRMRDGSITAGGPGRTCARACRSRRRRICASSSSTRWCSSPASWSILVNLYGADHVLLGTDYPYDMGDDDPLAFLGAHRRARPGRRSTSSRAATPHGCWGWHDDT